MPDYSGQAVRSLLKALSILSLFTRENPELRLRDICAMLEMPASTTHRLIRTLEKEDYITQNQDNGKYRLGAAAFILGSNVLDINKLVEVSLPYMAKLSAKYIVTTHVAVEQNGHVLCLEKIEPANNPVKTPPRGAWHFLHLTSLGKCLLAYTPPHKQQKIIQEINFTQLTPTSITSKSALIAELRRVQQLGYAIDACESSENLYCFGAPILCSDGTAIGALSVSLNSDNFPASAPSIIRDLKQSAMEISLALH